MADLIHRKNVEALSDDELAALRAGYQGMMGVLDNRGYVYFAGLHGVPDWYCWHHQRSRRARLPASLFLPWHRAYLLYFKNALRDQNANALLPWWDWTSLQSHSTFVPPAFGAPNVNGNSNPLYSARIYAPTANPPLDRMTQRFPGDPSVLPSPDDINQLITNATQFEDFSGQLEDIHDNIHGWTGGNNGVVGGDMGNLAVAAYDPIFWSHHCMIDRIWYLWQLKNGINTIPAQYLPMVLEPFGLTVNDVLNVNSLGYDYAVSATEF
jgi:tyrosinase